MEFEGSIHSGKHRNLNQLASKWKGTNRVWFSQDELVDESFMEGTIRSVLNGRFIIHEYAGTYQGKSIEGVCLLGCVPRSPPNTFHSVPNNQYVKRWVNDVYKNGMRIVWRSTGLFSNWKGLDLDVSWFEPFFIK